MMQKCQESKERLLYDFCGVMLSNATSVVSLFARNHNEPKERQFSFNTSRIRFRETWYLKVVKYIACKGIDIRSLDRCQRNVKCRITKLKHNIVVMSSSFSDHKCVADGDATKLLVKPYSFCLIKSNVPASRLFFLATRKPATNNKQTKASQSKQYGNIFSNISARWHGLPSSGCYRQWL